MQLEVEIKEELSFVVENLLNQDIQYAMERDNKKKGKCIKTLAFEKIG